MIAFVRGRVAEVGPDRAVVDVGGVGLALQCTPGTLAALRVGETTQLPTAMVVREDSLTLFGFADDDERLVFELAQTVTGVGPRLAQSLLATFSPEDLRRAVFAEDVTALTRVPGVGRKGAQRLVLELKDRLGPPLGVSEAAAEPSGTAGGAVAGSAAWRVQVHAGLVSLGWSAREAEAACDAVAVRLDAAAAGAEPEDGADAGPLPDPTDVGALLKLALRSLDRA